MLSARVSGLYADQLPADQALRTVRESNTVLADRIAPRRDRLMGVTALSLKNINASVEELERTSTQGFRATLLYPTVDGEMVVDLPMMEPIYAKIADLGWPIFLHGAGLAKDPTLKRLEDGGAGVWAQTIRRTRDACPDTKVEVLIPDFCGDWDALQTVLDARPDVLAHNMETVRRLHPADTMGEEHVVFGSDYCGGLGPLKKSLASVEKQTNP